VEESGRKWKKVEREWKNANKKLLTSNKTIDASTISRISLENITHQIRAESSTNSQEFLRVLPVMKAMTRPWQSNETPTDGVTGAKGKQVTRIESGAGEGVFLL